MSKNILLVSEEMIKDRTQIHGNIDPKLINPHIKVAQDLFIERLLGTALFNKLINDIDTTGTTTGDYKTLLDNYIVDALIWYVVADLPITLSYQFWSKGVVRKQGLETEMPSATELIEIANYYKNRAEHYANRLRLYLRQNAPTKFPEYLNPGSGIDSVHPDRNSFTMPVYLGDDNCYDRKSYEEKYQGNNPSCEC